MTTYRVTIDIEGKADAKALADLIRELGYNVHLYSLTPNSKPAQDTRAGKIVLEALSFSRATHYEEVGRALKAEGFNERSAAPLLSALVKTGIVRRTGLGMYIKTKQGEPT